MHRSHFITWPAVLFVAFLFGALSFAEDEPSGPPGDRIACQIRNIQDWVPAALSRDSYHIGPGDTLSINVQGKATLTYRVRPDAPAGESPNEVAVTPGGNIYLPLVGEVAVAGKTIEEAEELIRAGLSKYIRQFDLSVAVSKVRVVNVWISGEVENSGPQILPAVSTVSLAALQAGIKPTGSTRCITLIRNGEKRTVDLYRMIITGKVDEDIPLEAGDTIHVPAVTSYVVISGEVIRPGRYEMVGTSGKAGSLKVSDLLKLALGVLPSAALDKAYIQRIGEDGRKVSISINLRDQEASGTVLQSGDEVAVTSIASFQPMVRLIGEFKGDGVYQRVTDTTAPGIQNKSGIYYLKQGQTVQDVIAVTGGVTPQADLKRARIEREENGATRSIPVDLERLLIRGDVTADVALANGDSLVLPAVADKVHVFGEVKTPGSYAYSPNRLLIDYIGEADGPTAMAKLTDVSVVRNGSGDKPKIIKLNAKNAMRGTSTKDNPALEPGDIVYVPSKLVGGWRDVVQLVLTSLSLTSLFRN